MTDDTAACDLLDDAWAELVRDRSGAPTPDRPAIAVTGRSGSLPSTFRAEDTAVACVGVALTAASMLHGSGEGSSPIDGRHGDSAAELSLDREHVSVAVVSERHFQHDGRAAGAGFAPLSRFWEAADGWVRTHANYSWHRDALLRALATSDHPDAVAAAIAKLPAEEVEARVVGAGGVAGAVRSAAEWQTHPQGIVLAAEPIIGHQSLGDAPARRRNREDLPGRGIRVLDLTRVIAGPVCTRYLGALGADVLRVDPPGYPDLAPGALSDTLLAKSSSVLDLEDAGAAAIFHDLADRADVVVCGYRPGSLDRFGLGAEDLAHRHPGLVIVYLAAWGHTGPWAERRGFDSVVQAPTGIARGESTDGSIPGALPCQLLDHGTGYLAAAAALDGLRRQAMHGGTHIRRLSLARTARWLTEGSQADVPPPDHEPVGDTAWLVQLEGPDGTVSVVTPPGSLSGHALAWPGPPSSYGTDSPRWQSPAI